MVSERWEEPWTKLASFWTLATLFSFIGLLVAMVWSADGLGKLWLTWLILGVLTTFILWCIAFGKEGSG